jgi:hypothetical protein
MGGAPFPPALVGPPHLLRNKRLLRRPADRKSAGASDALEAPVIIGGPSRTRTLGPPIKRRGPARRRPSVFLRRPDSVDLPRLLRLAGGRRSESTGQRGQQEAATVHRSP